MNKTSVPTLIGVFCSLLTIWLLHTLFVVNDCLDHSGVYDYKVGKCLLENGQTYEGSFASFALVVYVIVGFVISLTVAKLIRIILK